MIRTAMIGNLTKDPECRAVRSGGEDVNVVNFTVAANHGRGENKQTEFIRVAAWRALGENCRKYLRKGSRVFVAGTPSVSAYINRDGNAVGSVELQLETIEFLSGKPNDPASPLAETPDDESIDYLL